MNREDVAYFVNSTPKYFYLLPLHFTLVKRYAEKLKWPRYMVTETPNDSVIQDLSQNLGVNILTISEKDRYFLESRVAACRCLPRGIKYILPIQEDFLLAGRIDEQAIEEALNIFDEDSSVVSIRLMPCPGPRQGQGHLSLRYKSSSYFILNEDFMFTYQATLWRREAYELFMTTLVEAPTSLFSSIPPIFKDETQRKKFLQIDFNIAENLFGQNKIRELFKGKLHLAWPRAHPSPNAVMLCPWPYRPTAVEKGKLGDWVPEFAKREGFPLNAV